MPLVPNGGLGKRWNALSYHRVREAVASGWLRFEHIDGKENPADILTKPLAWFSLRVFVEPLLLWKGDTKEAGASDPPGGSTNPEGSDVDPGLARSRDTARSVTDTRDVNGNGRNTRANVLWNNQYASLADETDGN